MRNLFIFIIIFSLLSVGVYASCEKINDLCDEKFYDKGHNSEENFEDAGIIYSSKFYSERMVVLYVDNDKYIIDGECNCRRSDDAKLFYCVDEIETVAEDIDDGKLDKVKFVNGKSREYIEFVFCKSKPSMDIDYKISNDKPNLNDIVDVEITIKNEGVKTAYNPKLTFPVPKGLVFKQNPDVYYDGENIVFEADSFVPSAEEVITLSFRVANTGQYNINSLFEYTFEGEVVEKKDSLKITVISPYDIDINAPGTVSLDEVFDLEVEMQNELEEEDITIEEFTLKLPEGIEVYDDNRYTSQDWESKRFNDFTFETEDERTFTYNNGVIEKDDTIVNTKKLIATTQGQHAIEISYKIKAKGQIYEEVENYDITVKTYKIPEVKLLVTEEVIGGDEYWMRVTATNEDENVDFNTLDLRLTSDITTPEDLTKKDLPHDTEMTLFNQFYTTKEVFEAEEHNFLLVGSFKDQNGEVYTVREEAAMEIVPPKANITISIKPSKTLVVPGEEFGVEVRVKNLEDIYVGLVKGTDDVPPELEITGGRMAGSVSLEKNEEKQLYEYKVKVPKTFDEQHITISTDVLTQIGPRTFANEDSATIDVNVSLVMIDGEIKPVGEVVIVEDNNETDSNLNETIDDGNDGTNTEQYEKKGFFGRLFENIGNWIDGLFS